MYGKENLKKQEIVYIFGQEIFGFGECENGQGEIRIVEKDSKLYFIQEK